MPTFSLKIPTQEMKDEVQQRFKKWKDNQPGSSSMYEAFNALLDLGEKGIESLKTRNEPTSVEDFISLINCPHLRYEDFNFKCFERMEKRKKPDILGDEQTKVQTRCDTCKQGKAEAILEQYQKKLRGQNIKGILSMIKQFQTFAVSGVPSTIYFCNRIPSRQVITGKKTIHCGKVQMQIVPIDPTCKDPRCRFFQEFTIKVEQEFPKEALALIEGIAEDYKRIEDLTPEPKKEVESEQ
jgi:hypothetical protein